MDRSRIATDEYVGGQYRTTARLETRMSVWRPGPDGRTPQDVVIDALAEAGPRRLIEVGCGTGAFAARCARELGCQVVALDASPAMVETTRALGVDAIVGEELWALIGFEYPGSPFGRENGRAGDTAVLVADR
jgi:methylase of polypeptide subunit release factors